jgi:hypothetical protein
MQWRTDAACAGTDWTQFFPQSEHHSAVEQLRPVAEAHCHACPVIHQCADWADRHREAGLWAAVYRVTRQSIYTRTPLLDHAPMADLPPRAAGAGVGAWVA